MNLFKHSSYNKTGFPTFTNSVVSFLRFSTFTRRGFALRLGNFTGVLRGLRLGAFTLVEMLMALLIVSVILSASLPVISSRTKSQAVGYSKYSSVPIGMIAM